MVTLLIPHIMRIRCSCYCVKGRFKCMKQQHLDHHLAVQLLLILVVSKNSHQSETQQYSPVQFTTDQNCCYYTNFDPLVFVHLPPAIHARVQCMGVRDLHQVKQIKYYTEHSECHMSGMPFDTCNTSGLRFNYH